MPQPTALKPPSTARTAGRSGGCGGACDASPLSCFLFRPRKSREKRRKRSHINASNASVIWASRVSQTPLQAPFPTSINGYHAAKKFLSQWPAKRSTFAFAGESGYTLAFANRIAHSGLHAETGAFRTGPLSLPSAHSARSRTSPGRVSERQTLPLLGLGRGCSRRTQRACGAAMRLCASLLRGVAAPLGCVIFFASAEIGICTSGAHGFPRVRGGGGITTLGAFHTVRKPCVAVA